MSMGKIIIGLFLGLFMLGVYVTLPPTITENESIYQIAGIGFICLFLIGGLYVAKR